MDSYQEWVIKEKVDAVMPVLVALWWLARQLVILHFVVKYW